MTVKQRNAKLGKNCKKWNRCVLIRYKLTITRRKLSANFRKSCHLFRDKKNSPYPPFPPKQKKTNWTKFLVWIKNFQAINLQTICVSVIYLFSLNLCSFLLELIINGKKVDFFFFFEKKIKQRVRKIFESTWIELKYSRKIYKFSFEKISTNCHLPPLPTPSSPSYICIHYFFFFHPVIYFIFLGMLYWGKRAKNLWFAAKKYYHCLFDYNLTTLYLYIYIYWRTNVYNTRRNIKKWEERAEDKKKGGKFALWVYAGRLSEGMKSNQCRRHPLMFLTVSLESWSI